MTDDRPSVGRSFTDTSPRVRTVCGVSVTTPTTSESVAPPPAADALVGHRDRLVPLDSAHNVRDLGGYVVADGSEIAWGRLFRSDLLVFVTDDDIGVLDALGIRTVIDLRSDQEFADHGRFPFEKLPVAFHHLSIIDTTWMRDEVPDFDDDEQGGIDFLTWAYRAMIDQGPDRFAHAMHVLSVPGAMPAVFHCAAGKDRTGLLAALILGGLGVDDDTIAADFSASAGAMERKREWALREMPDWVERMSTMPGYMMSAHPDAIRTILDDLRARHGSIVGYLSSIGVGSATLADLRSALITPGV